MVAFGYVVDARPETTNFSFRLTTPSPKGTKSGADRFLIEA